MIAVADVIPGQSGTEIKVECQYGEVNEPTPGAGHETYSIFVVDRSGNASEIKEWPATPNKLMRPSGTTPLKVSEIADLEIRQTDTDEVVLRAPSLSAPDCSAAGIQRRPVARRAATWVHPRCSRLHRLQRVQTVRKLGEPRFLPNGSRCGGVLPGPEWASRGRSRC